MENNINIRFKMLREACGKSQEEFGKAIGISKSGVSDIENKRRNVTEQHIIMLKNWKAYNINEDWLRYGTGEMFVENDDSLITTLSREYNLDEIDQKILKSYLRLNYEHRKVIKEYIINLAKDISQEETAYAYSGDLMVAEEVKAYRKELEAEQKGETSSASDIIKDDLKKA